MTGSVYYLRLVKAFFEFHSDRILVVALADKDDLVFAVAVAGIPVFPNFGIVGERVELLFFIVLLLFHYLQLYHLHQIR